MILRITQSGLLAALLLALGTGLRAQTGLDGIWVTYNFGPSPNFFDLHVDGARVTGSVSRDAEVIPIADGSVSGNTATFTVVYAAGHRTNTYTARLNGDALAITRSVRVKPGGNSSGTGIFGGQGPMELVASRLDARGQVLPRALFGSWKWDPQRSTIDPAPFGWGSEQRSYFVRPDGAFGIAAAAVGPEGDVGYSHIWMRADARDYPVLNNLTAVGLLETGAATTWTQSLRAINDRTFEVTYKTAGVVTSRARITVSPDGLTMTEAGTNVDAQGRTTTTWSQAWARVVAVAPST